MYPYINLTDSVTIGSYGLMLAIAYLVGRWYFLKNLDKQIPNLSGAEILIILLLAFGVIGAKLMFILKNPDRQSLLFSGEGFSSQGAILGAMLATYLFTYFKKIKMYKILDASAPAAILAYAIARIGCFLSGDECYGTPTDLPWAMSFPNGIASSVEHPIINVHPVQLYEVAYSLVIFVILLKRQNVNNKHYSQFFTLLGLWGISRFLVEFISNNEKLVFSMSGSQVGALIMFLMAASYFTQAKLRDKVST